MELQVTDERWDHIRAVSVTSLAAFAGLLAGITANQVASSGADSVGVIVLGIAILLQFPVLRVIGVGHTSLGPKDYLFITFMTFSFWFITWGIMMTTGAGISL